MRCYIKTNCSKFAFVATVVTEQDYHDGGPHAHTHRTAPYRNRETAEAQARKWAEENGYRIVAANGIAA